jgi:WD40 repeat protein
MTFTVAPLTSCTYAYIHVSHVYKLACTLHRTINLLPLVCCTPTSDSSITSEQENRTCQFVGNGRYACLDGGFSGLKQFFDLFLDETLHSRPIFEISGTFFAACETKAMIAIATFIYTMEVWDLGTQGQQVDPDSSHDRVHGAVLSSDSSLLATISGSGTIELWDVQNGTLYERTTLSCSKETVLAIAADRSQVAILSQTAGSKELWLWDRQSEPQRSDEISIESTAWTWSEQPHNSYHSKDDTIHYGLSGVYAGAYDISSNCWEEGEHENLIFWIPSSHSPFPEEIILWAENLRTLILCIRTSIVTFVRILPTSRQTL